MADISGLAECRRFPTGWLCVGGCTNPAHDEFLHATDETCPAHGERVTFTAPFIGYVKEPSCTCRMIGVTPASVADETCTCGRAPGRRHYLDCPLVADETCPNGHTTACYCSPLPVADETNAGGLTERLLGEWQRGEIPVDAVLTHVAERVRVAVEQERAARLALVAILAELVALKDGPRDADYERRKPLAWARARALLSPANTEAGA